MDELQLLKDHHDAQPGPSPEIVAGARLRLVQHTGHRRGFRFTWPLATGLGMTAAAASVALVVGASGSGTAPVKPQPELTARQVLLAAAAQVDRQPQAIGKYLHTTMLNTLVFSTTVNGHSFRVGQKRSEDSWDASDPAHDASYTWTRELGTQPLTAADAAAWKAAGSPAQFPVTLMPFNKSHQRTVMHLDMPIRQAGKPTATSQAAGTKGNMGAGYLGTKWLTVKDVLALPADPARLKALLIPMYAGHAPDSGLSMPQQVWLFTVARDLVNGSFPARPAVQAAAYRMLAGLSGVTAIGTVKDPTGRTGTAIAINENSNSAEHFGLIRHMIIIDRTTGRILAEEEIALKPAANGMAAGLPPGTAYATLVYPTSAWTDQKPQAPAAP